MPRLKAPESLINHLTEFNLMTALAFGILLMAVAGIGSAIGMSKAANAALGVKAEKGKECPNLAIYVLMPFSQTLYGLVLLAMAVFLFSDKFPTDPVGITITMISAVFAGACIGTSALTQGAVGARACDAIGKTGHGKGEAIMFMGTIEKVALFMMVMFIVGMFILL